MLKNLFKNKFSILLIIFLVFALACIRAFENQLFYDPFLEYFKSNYQNVSLPKITIFSLYTNFFFRYLLNSIVSLAIIYLCFKDLSMIKFLSVLYIILFILLISSFHYILIYWTNNNKMAIFYVRRFLIQPLFLLLFIVGIYFQKTIKQ